MPNLETSLTIFELKVAEAQKSADALVKNLRQLQKAASTGHVAELGRGLTVIVERAERVRTAAAALPEFWSFDTKSYLEQDYQAELLREAKSQGLTLIERDGRLYCFPVVLRIDPREASIRIGTKRESRLRPKALVRQLAAAQKAGQRFSAPRFLEALYQGYQRVLGASRQKPGGGPGAAVPLAEVYDILTLLPGLDYPIDQFGRDLMLLSRQPDLRTRDGCAFEFPGSTMSKERIKRISVYDEDGREAIFIAVRFTKEK